MIGKFSSMGIGDPDLNHLYIFGAGGAAREIAWLARERWGDAVMLTFVVNNAAYLVDPVNEVPVMLLENIGFEKGDGFILGVGDIPLRRLAAAQCSERGFRPAILIHPGAKMSGLASVGQGTVICAGTILTTNIEIGQHVYVNVGCTISHDVRIGDYSVLCPGVHVAGHVEIGRDVFVGIGASIIDGCEGAPLIIGDSAVIAAGACVTESVDSGSLVAGVPAIRKR